MDTITITHHARTVALAAPARFWLTAHTQVLPINDAARRHVCFMALYARDILTGDLPGPHSDTDADRFARVAITSRYAGRRCDASARHRARARSQPQG